MEDAVAILNNMRIAPSDYTPPPQVQVDGALPVKGATWIINGIDWGDNVLWHQDGYRVRQDGIVHLLQYVAPDQLSIRPSTVSHTHNVVAGETLASIAKQEYGDPKYAAVIKSANNIRDPKQLPKKLTIPPLVGK
jgi:nucleoid-associated protein YgaU